MKLPLAGRYPILRVKPGEKAEIGMKRPTAAAAGLAFAMLGLSTALSTRAQTSADALRQWDQSVDRLIRRVAPSVVQILVSGYGAVNEGERGNAGVVIGRQRAIGSGFVVDADGYILTNAHVVNGAQHVQIVLPPAESDDTVASALTARVSVVPARIVGVAREIDLALLKVDATGLTALPLVNYRNLRQGETVFAFGSPQGLRNTVTHGVISAVARQIDPDSPMVYIQTDAPINPGNSGGPLVNASGEVVGVNTFILSQSGGNEGLGFAIPSGVVRVVYEQLRKFGHLHRPEIGVQLQTISPEMAQGLSLVRNYGVIVSDVVPGGPAEAAGVRIGDILLNIDGKSADNLPYVAFHMLSRNEGERIHLEVLRGKRPMSFDVLIKERPHEMDQVSALADPEKNLVPQLGILGVEIDREIASMIEDLRDPYGIIVAARAAGARTEIPLTTGDVIRALNGEPVNTLDKLRASLKSLAPGAPVVLQIQREGRLQFLTFAVE
ncbi:MAG TPA: trypsin-like peptidase domain-containing protein [Candidatus Acidoferrum sp.]|nr:trypsin-like peptidase domain-containing protein [Candidatus Acidoferrum sp.]